MSEKYIDEYYTYEDVPTCSRVKPSCAGSKYLFCDLSTFTCLSRIVEGGNCTNFELVPDACEPPSICTEGICSTVTPTVTQESYSTPVNTDMLEQHENFTITIIDREKCQCDCLGNKSITNTLTLQPDYLWFTVTVLKNTIDYGRFEPAINATVTVNGVNYDGSYFTTVSDS